MKIRGAHILNKTSRVGSRAVADSIRKDGALRGGDSMGGFGVYFHFVESEALYGRFPHVIFEAEVAEADFVVVRSSIADYCKVKLPRPDGVLPIEIVRFANLDEEE